MKFEGDLKSAVVVDDAVEVTVRLDPYPASWRDVTQLHDVRKLERVSVVGRGEPFFALLYAAVRVMIGRLTGTL